MYREILMDQWKNLYCDFAGEYELLQNQGNAATAFNRWYEARVYRWSSVTYSEGILLEQENNPAFSKELQSVLKSFRFHDVASAIEKPIWMGVAIGIAAGIFIGGVLMLFHGGRIKAIVSAIVLFVVIIVAFQKKNTDGKVQEQKRVKDGYIQQLRDYQNKLVAVCDKYKVV